eukprot:5806176-Pyramimonas_sp.AAC.1
MPVPRCNASRTVEARPTGQQPRGAPMQHSTCHAVQRRWPARAQAPRTPGARAPIQRSEQRAPQKLMRHALFL